MINYSLRDIERNIDSVYLERGRHYADQRRVIGLQRSVSGELVATVQGSEPEPYEVIINVLPGQTGARILGHCSCPVGTNCKHVAAVLLNGLERHKPRGTQTVEVPRPPPRDLPPRVRTPVAQAPRPSALPASLSLWFDELRQPAPAPTKSEGYPNGVAQRVLYVLEVNPVDHRVHVQLMTARQLKDGSYSAASRWHNVQGALQTPPSFVIASDLRVFRRLQLDAQYMVGGVYVLSGPLGLDLLEEIVTTGRCHLEDPQNPALRWQPARPASAQWRVDDVGTQSLTILTDPPSDHVLPMAPPVYVVSASGECGSIELGVDPRVAENYVRAPDVPASLADAVRAELAARLEGTDLPVPRAIKHEDITPARITPCLRLDSVAVFSHSRSRYAPFGGVLDLAVLTFDYDGVTVTRATPGQISAYRDGKLVRMKRDAKAEKAAHALLESLDLHKVMSVMSPFPEAHRHDYTMIDAIDWIDLVARDLDTLREQGWRVEIAPEFRFRVAQVSDWSAHIEDVGQDWFDLRLEANVDGKREDLLPLVLAALRVDPELLTAIQHNDVSDDKSMVLGLEDGRFMPVPVGRLRAIARVLHEMLDQPTGKALRLPRLDAGRLAQLEAAMPLRWQGGEELRALGQRLTDFKHVAPVAPPREFGAELRAYQGDGLAWLQFLRQYGINGILADDMGLGKTVQALAHLLTEKQSGRLDRPALVVCPTSVLPNWRAEAQRFAPQLRLHVSHGLDRKLGFDQMAKADVVFTTYPLLSRDKEVLRKQAFHVVILDEAQLIKNAQTIAAKVVGELDARHRLCMTGTPLENNLGELWSLFHFLMPGFLGDAQGFRRLYRTPIEKHGNDQRRESLVRRIKPFILRRTKEQVATELPPKTEMLRTVAFEGAQRDLYETVRVSMHERVRAEIQARGFANSHIVVLDALLKLRQICCDPRLLKLDSARKVKESAKLEMLMEMLPELLAEGRRVLLFSQFTSMLALIEEALKDQKIRYVKLTGDTKNREQPVKSFQGGEVNLFLISLKAGGTGLNLTGADTVIHYDPWWNPAVENQATDRAHRIGQDKPVFVYKLIVAGSVEEKITAMQQSKAALAASLLDGATKGGAALTADDIAALFEPMAQ